MLVSQVHMMAGKNVKKKYLMCPIPIKMLKQEATPNSSLHNLRFIYQKGAEKLVKDEYICSLACQLYSLTQHF